MIVPQHMNAEQYRAWRAQSSVTMRRPHLRDVPPVLPLSTGFALRQATDADDPALAALLNVAFGDPRDDPWDGPRVRERLTHAPDVRAVYVVEWQGQLVATASSQYVPERYPGSGKVHWVGTHPDHRGRGLASALLARLLVDFAARGDTDAMLHTQIYRLPAIRRYFAFGFLPELADNGEDHRPRWSAAFQSLFGGKETRKD